jgi:tetratricopeptide (TPR) repeat protein
LEIKRTLGDKKGISSSLNNLGLLYKDQGKLEEAKKLYLESLEIKRTLGDKKGISESLNNLGLLYKNQGKIEEAEKLYMESLEIRRSLGDKKGISSSLSNLGVLYKNQSKIEEAEKLYLESLEIYRFLGVKKGISGSLNNLGLLYKDQGKIEEAEKLYLESLEIRRLLGDKKGISSSLNNLGVLEIEKNAIQKARQYFIESIELIKTINHSSLLPSIHRAFEYFSTEERAIYFTWAMELDNSQYGKKEKLWAEDIQLMNLCYENSILDIESTQLTCKKIIDLAIDCKLEDPDDLPIETFIIVSKKLISQSELEIPKELCNQALEWIGDRNTIMKKKVQEILL